MSSGFEESTKSASSSSGNSSNNGAADFECNICYELARDPVVTLCGHLFCWPCLYRWLHRRSRSQGCPLCKALVEEQKLVPLYGKGRSVTDSRMEIPPRPSGQRPPTVEEEVLEAPRDIHVLDVRLEIDQPIEEFRAVAEQRFNEYIDERIQEYRAVVEQHIREQIDPRIEEYRVSLEQRFNESIDQRIQEYRAASGV